MTFQKFYVARREIQNVAGYLLYLKELPKDVSRAISINEEYLQKIIESDNYDLTELSELTGKTLQNLLLLLAQEIPEEIVTADDISMLSRVPSCDVEEIRKIMENILENHERDNDYEA